jgi:hypothetical protein
MPLVLSGCTLGLYKGVRFTVYEMHCKTHVERGLKEGFWIFFNKFTTFF